MRTNSARGRPLSEGSSGGLLCFQTILLVLVATWSLGGRADGAIWWIGGIAWSSLLVFILDPHRRQLIARKQRKNLILASSWLLLILILAIGLFNPIMEIREVDGVVSFHPANELTFLPAVLHPPRAAEYGFLLSGVLVQATMLWNYLHRRTHIRWLVASMGVNALILASVGALLNFLGTEKILGLFDPVNDTFFSAFRYHNHWTAFALLSAGQCAALTAWYHRLSKKDPKTKRRRPDVFWLCALILVSITLPMSSARAGILFFLIFWGVVLIRLLTAKPAESEAVSSEEEPSRTRRAATRRTDERRLSRSKRLRTIGVGAAAILVTAYALFLAQHHVQQGWTESERQIEAARENNQLLPHRVVHGFNDAWPMFEERPWLGWGIGSYKYAFYIFAGDEYRRADGTLKSAAEFAHNDWAQYLAELGMIGFALLIGVPVGIIAQLRDRTRLPAFSGWLLLPVALVLILALFEFPLSNPAVLMIFGIQSTLALRHWHLAGTGIQRERQPATVSG